jgi:hypothetical protein
MQKISLRLLAPILLLFVLVQGCARNRMYRTDFEPYTNAHPNEDPLNKAVVETAPEYKLGFVEFDEEGWFWDPRQAQKVEQVVSAATGAGDTNNPSKALILFFVHGWKNNAAYNCANVDMIRKALVEMNHSEKIRSAEDHRPPRNVVGIYCGWRGLSAKVEPFKELSSWPRKNVAHKVGGHGAMTQLLVELEALQTASNRRIAAGGLKTELIIVGHSFGAAAVYSAISQFTTERFVDDLQNGRALKPLGDQVILLNPAFEASRHFNLNRLATNIAKYPDSQRPVLSIFTSKGDWATHYYLPLEQFLPTIFENMRDPFQRHSTRQAVGWFKPYVTHSLIYKPNALAKAEGLSILRPETRKHVLNQAHDLQASIQNVDVQRQKWRPNAKVPATYSFDDCILKPEPTYRPGDPFLIVSVDKEIMKDHNDITNPILINFLREYIQFCHEDLPASH